MQKSIQCDIISLTQTAFSGRISSITVPGVDGELTILPHHIPLVTPLSTGEIVIRQDEKEIYFVISGGFLVIEPNKITVLSDSADRLDELNEEKIREAKVRAEKLLTEKKFADDRAFADASAFIERSLAQLKVIQKRKRHK